MPLSPREIDPEKLYTTEETSELLRLGPQTIRKKLREGSIHGKKVGRRWLIKGKEIRRYIGE
ncbi:hypothetical protein DRP53_03310 [candidate division WOR-3 bacterium]|uniref:Helix-turn-helix domain-containing protein n=1 Tax=candidate division WOR-3 bacterium TaxID=2052148 RepID=A0A660SLP8_UNCW3|nr:MAG: hypothetical protein DRP53_03310 [candidate division WOR-3 bacterium]